MESRILNIYFTTEEEVKDYEELRKLAFDQRRSNSGLGKEAIKNYLKKHGE